MLSVSKKDFLYIKNNGRVINFQTLRVFFLEDTKFSVAVIISKKIFPKAVGRNKIKRKIKAILINNKEKINKGKYLIYVRNNDESKIKADMVNLLEQMKK